MIVQRGLTSIWAGSSPAPSKVSALNPFRSSLSPAGWRVTYFAGNRSATSGPIS